MKFGWKMRIGMVLSALWLCLVFLIADDYRRMTQVLGLGLLPLVFIWGILWAISGWRAQRPAEPETPEAAVLESRRKRKDRIRAMIAVVAVLGIGLFAATWQFHAAESEAGGNDVSRWFGEWLVYGLFAYVVFRFIPRQPAGLAAVLAALVVVGGVNYRAHAAISEERQALASLSRAAPLLNKMQIGAAVSDQEVKDAQVGVLEPLLLAQANFGREVAVVADTYQKAVAQLDPEQMLSPTSIAAPNSRYQTRSKLKIWAQAANEYKSQVASATGRAKLGVQAAVRQMPEVYTRSTTSGFEESAAQMKAFVDRHVAMENEAGQAVTAILDLLDANPNAFFVDRGPPPNLLFRDEAVLAAYRRHFNAVLDVGKREGENQARFMQAQTSRTERLEGVLKK